MIRPAFLFIKRKYITKFQLFCCSCFCVWWGKTHQSMIAQSISLACTTNRSLWGQVASLVLLHSWTVCSGWLANRINVYFRIVRRVYCDRKKPFLHSRIVTVSLLTVTSVMITWSEWLLFGSQSRGGAGFGDVGICGNRLTILKSFAILLLFTFSIVFSTWLLWTDSWLFSGLIDLNAPSCDSTGWFAFAIW